MKRLLLPWLGQNCRLIKEYGPQSESEEAWISIGHETLKAKRLAAASFFLESFSNEEKGFF
jgi:hypothetical protein